MTDFVNGHWSGVSRKFIYATSCPGVTTQLAEEIETQAEKLVRSSIEFEVWDREEMSTRLRSYPELVDAFFGRAWVEVYCGQEAAASLRQRLDAHQAAALRRELAHIYQASFGVTDSGILALRLKASGAASLHDRFITPDVLVTSGQDAVVPDSSSQRPDATTAQSQATEAEFSAFRSHDLDAGEWYPGLPQAGQPSTHRVQPEERWAADKWIGQGLRQVIVGEPGAGKSTLLRYLVLDLLREDPTWTAAAERWGQRLPVWLPFQFFTQRVTGETGENASIGAAIRAWLEQHDVGRIWPLVEAALTDDRLLLVVDGLDEWVGDEAGRYAATALETFASSRSAAVVLSTRPYGMAKLALGPEWTYARIAPLSALQQRELARRYFYVAADTGDHPPSEEAIARSVDGFLAEIDAAPDLRAVAGIPLFLVLLIGLRLSNQGRLPDRRFEVYDRAVQLLIADHPARRRVAAAVTARRHRLDDRQIRAILAEVAFVSQTRGEVSTIPQARLRRDFLEALRNPDYLALDDGTAGLAADELVNVAEGELGVLVRCGPTDLGFLHRMLQAQLAAEYAADRLTPDEQGSLFAEHVDDPRWHDVLLAIMWRLRRPSELRALVKIIREQVNDSPSGLRAREFLAEVVFGSFGLPGADAQRFVPELIDVVETHPYDKHRGRLLDIVFTGLENVTTAEAVEAAVARWSLLVASPSASLVWHLAQLPNHPDLSAQLVMLLVRAIRHPEPDVAYGAAVAIATRCSEAGAGDDSEGDKLRAELLKTLADPPSAVSAAATLAALALGWREDRLVDEGIHLARGSRDEGLRIVALADTLGVLRSNLLGANDDLRHIGPTRNMSQEERAWLVARLAEPGSHEAPRELLITTISEVMYGSEPDLKYCLHRMESGGGLDIDLVRRVALTAFREDARMAEFVCRQLRTKEHAWPVVCMWPRDRRAFGRAFAPGSKYNALVAGAIEDRLATLGADHLEMELHELAVIDSGPRIREALLSSLSASSFPDWTAEALAEHFGEDACVAEALRTVLLGEPIRASKIANVAPEVLGAGEAIPRLLQILREAQERPGVARPRFDIVASALVRAFAEHGSIDGAGRDAIAAEALDLMPMAPDRFTGDPSYILAVGFYPSPAAQLALTRLSAAEGHPITPFLRLYRNDSDAVRPYVAEAEQILRSIPASSRAHLCQLLADRPVAPKKTLRLTRNWADEVAEANKSVASLAYHRALLEGRVSGLVTDAQWSAARTHLAEQASCYGFDHEARRRAAWVGMCVLDDWSMLDGVFESIGDPRPVGVSLTQPLDGPDFLLLQMLAIRWQHLRRKFGDDLITRLSGLRGGRGDRTTWDALALVAQQNQTLESDLEGAVAADPTLMRHDGILGWFVSQPSRTIEAVIDALLACLTADNNARNLAIHLLSDPERIRLDPAQLRPRLEAVETRHWNPWGDPALETLAVLFPDHPRVREAWCEFRRMISDEGGQGESEGNGPHPQTYLAIAYAAVESPRVPWLLARDLRWLETTGLTFYDSAFVSHVTRRLRRDAIATASVREVVMAPSTTDVDAALLVSLLAAAVPLDGDLAQHVNCRIQSQSRVILSPIVRDRVISASVSAKTVLTRVADSSHRTA